MGCLKHDGTTLSFGKARNISRSAADARPETAQAAQQTRDEEVEELEPVRDVIATGVPLSMDKDMLDMFFESQRLSGGGAVENVDLARPGTAVISFKDVSGT